MANKPAQKSSKPQAKTKDIIIGLQGSAPKRTDEEVFDLDLFSKNPLAAYRAAIEKTYRYNHFYDSQEFKAIITKVILFDEVKKENLLEQISAPEIVTTLKTKDKGLSSLLNSISFYEIIIPEIDAAIPIPKKISGDGRIEAFYGNFSRRAVFFDNQKKLKVGNVVIVSNALISDKNKTPCEIKKVLTEDIIAFTEEEAKKDNFKKCITDFNLNVEKAEEKPEPPPSSGNLKEIPNDPSIYSWASFDEEDASKRYNPIRGQLIFKNLPKSLRDPAQEKTNKLKTELDKVIAKCENKVQSPSKSQEQNKVENKKPSQNAFLKNNFATDKEIIDSSKAKIFTSLSTGIDRKKAIILEAAENYNTPNPIISVDEDERNIKMIVVRTVPFLTMAEYKQSIIETKKHPAHFAIDYNGDIYQLTDTKNLVKCYNPTIDEVSIHISLLCITHKYSQKTLKLISEGTGGLTATERLIKRAALMASLTFDKFKLEGYIRSKLNQFSLSFKDGNISLSDRNIGPAYRLAPQPNQLKSLKYLLQAIKSSYGLEKLEFPHDLLTIGNEKIKVYKNFVIPEVLSGDYQGIVAPFNFSYSDNDYLNLFIDRETIENNSI